MADKSCPSCGAEMKLRNGKNGQFWGCSGYPQCRKILNYNGNGLSAAAKVAANNPEPKKEFIPSAYQKAVFDFIANGSGNAVVEAVAGSGKTTTIVEALKLTTGDVLFCAFNKHIQQELAHRAPGHVTVSTIHSIGFRALCKALPYKPEVDSGKLMGIVREFLPGYDEQPLRGPLCDLVSFCKKTLTDPTDPQAVEGMAAHYGLELNGDGPRLIGLVPQVMGVCQERLSVIDFDDMLWLPLVLSVPVPRFDWVFVDEAQDLSPAQLEVVKKSVKAGGRVAVVADRRQSIYGFTGADTNAVPRLIEELGATVLPLSITYRCPKRVVELAKRIVPQIEHADWAEDGEVVDVSPFKLQAEVRDRDLVLCRVNAPLVSLCYSLIRQGRKAAIRGRDIGKGLLALVDRLGPSSVNDLMVRLREYEDHETVRLERAGKEARIQALQDKCDTLEALCDGIRDLSELRWRISSIFDDETKDGVILSSVHRAKGDEADRVFILKPELMPHPLARQAWQQEQEMNLMYVAYTRARKSLAFVR